MCTQSAALDAQLGTAKKLYLMARALLCMDFDPDFCVNLGR